MKFKSSKLTKMVKIGELRQGDTFIDPANDFSEEEVFMVISMIGYDCNIEFDNDDDSIAAVSLTTGDLWSYRITEEVIPVTTVEITFKPITQ